MNRLVAASCGAVLVGLLPTARASMDDEVRRIPYVEVLRPDQKPLRGFPIPSDSADESVLLVGEKDQALHSILWEDIKDFQMVGQRPVTQVPSKALVEGMALDDRRARDECFAMLAEQEHDPVAALLDGLDHKSAEARWRCLELLARMETSRWSARLRRCLKDEDVRVRRLALSAYARGEPEDLVTVASRMLRKEEDRKLLHDVILVLGRTGDAHSVDFLLEHLDGTEDRSLRLVTFASLKRLTQMNFGRDESAWSSWWSNHRDEVLRAQEAERHQARD